MSVLEARQIYRFYAVDGAQLPVRHDITSRLETGEFCTLLAPSGTGTSTLLTTLAWREVPRAAE